MHAEPLTPIAMCEHSHWGWKRAVGYGFARRVTTVPLAIGEITRVAQSIPVAFSHQAGSWAPLAILGPVRGTNVYVDSARHWRGLAVPGGLRVYPFCLEPGSGQLSLWGNYKPSPLSEEGVTPFFANGQLSAELRSVQSFLERRSVEINKASDVLGWLSRMEILAPWEVPGLEKPAPMLEITGLFRVDIDRLHALGDKALLGLLRAGHLQWLYGHLASLDHAGRFKEIAKSLVSALEDGPSGQKTSDKSAGILSAIAEDLGDAEL